MAMGALNFKPNVEAMLVTIDDGCVSQGVRRSSSPTSSDLATANVFNDPVCANAFGVVYLHAMDGAETAMFD
jgi:hypothetical protein